MCLAALALGQSERFPLVLASNRDEFFDRPTAPLDWWQPAVGLHILGGRDLRAGGTWLGLTPHGRLALVTNVRQGLDVDPTAPSRGALVPGWLSATEPFDIHWERLARSGHRNFNLIAADIARGDWCWAGSVAAAPLRLSRGIHGLSNAELDTPWPKVRRLKSAVMAALQEQDAAGTGEQSATGSAAVDRGLTDPLERLTARLFVALSDVQTANDADLPDTGIPLELERRLSSAFIREPEGRYGTRCSTLVLTERRAGESVTHVIEHSFAAGPMANVIIERRTQLTGWSPAGQALGTSALPQVVERVLQG